MPLKMRRTQFDITNLFSLQCCMFEEKEKIKFLAEGIRNIAGGLIISGFVALATTPYMLTAGVIAIAGCVAFSTAYLLIRN